MARTSATISVGADTRQLEKDIQRALGRDFKFKGLNEKAFTQPLGRITGAANEFQKSLDASNARVIAFGASAGLIYSVERAFTALVKSTIDVQKSLTDINVILNVSTNTLQKFGGDLFSIAKNTAQSFDTVAQAATEFSRQGLGLEETLKRTRDALILTRLSGLDTVSSVEALTATINSFSEAALDSTTIINKLANVDAAFAVSSGDLAEAIKRVGSSAQDAGVDFDQLLAIVTSVQQTTARGGAVIGNSLKTIFTRIQRTDTLDQLQQLGIQVRTLEGNTLPAIQILSNLATTFNQLGDAQRAQVAETVGGIFQINILRAALADLGKEYSVYSRALDTSANATDQAISRNEKLNETLSALINRTFVNLTQLGADFGKISLQPTFEGGLNLLNKGLESITADSQGIGTKIAKGIFEGIGTFISGPGVILITAVFGKLFLNLAKFAGESLKTLLNVNTQAEQRAQIQAKINQVLAQETNLVQAVYNKQISVLDVENKILNIIRQQTLERERAASLSTTITGGLLGRGVTSKGGVLKAKSAGFIPNFEMSEIFGALAGGYTPGNIRRMNIPGEGSITYNSAEKVKRFPGLSQPAIMPPSQSSAGKNYKDTFGSIYGFNPYAAEGFIPNFSVTSLISETIKGNINQQKALTQLKTEQDRAKYLQGVKSAKIVEKLPEAIYNANNLGVVGVAGLSGTIGKVSTQFKQLGYPNDPRSVTFTNIQGRTLNDLANSKIKDKEQFSRSINTLFAGPLYTLASQIFGKINPDSKFLNLLQSSTRKNVNLFPKGTEGSIFEAAVNLGVKKGTGALEQAFNQDLAQKPFDFEEASSPSKEFNDGFKFAPPVIKADAKRIVDTDSAREIISKAYNAGLPGLPRPITKKLASQGFIPNFTALSESIDRELGAGVSPSRVRIGRDKRLTSAYNPLGLGVYNTQDEPLGLGQGIARMGSNAKTAGMNLGFVPNYAEMISSGGIIIPSEAQFNAEKRARQEVTKELKTLKGELRDTSRNVKTFGSGFLALSIGLPIILQTLSQFSSDQDIKTQAVINGISTAISMIGTGAFVGAGLGRAGGIYGAAAGAVAGAGMATYQVIKALDAEDLKNLQKNLQFLQDEFQASQSSLQKVIPLIEEYKKVQASAADEQTKAFNLEKIVNEISTGLRPLGEETANKVLEAFKNADYDTIGLIINKKLAESSAQLSNEGVKILLEEFKAKGKAIEDPTTAKVIGKSLLSLQASTGESVIRKLAQTEEGKQRIDIVSKNLEKLLEERNRLEVERIEMEKNPIPTISRKNVFGPGGGSKLPSFSEGMANFDDGLTPPQMLKEKVKSLNTNLNDILSTIEPLYKDAEETRVKFAEWKIASGSTALNQESSSALIEQIVKDLRSQGIITEKINDSLKTSGITSIEEYIQAFKENTLTLRKADDFVKKRLFAQLQDPMLTLGKEQAALIQNIGEDILTPSRRSKVYDEIDKETEKLREMLAQEVVRRDKLNVQLENKEITEEQYQKDIEKTIITEDQYRKRLEALREKILLDQRKSGRIFAEDFRGGRQESREARILGQEAQLEDFGSAFFDEFDYRTEDSFREAQLGAKEAARTIKSEFNNAFFDFAQGTATAGQAFEKFALNISNKIQQLALEFGTNLLFGKLFGSTSNILGLGGDSGGGGFGSLFGFKKGGIVKGYSSGGTVTGGSGTKDDVPAMLSAGEYVIRKSSVNKYGAGFLGMLNGGRVGKYQYGGEGSFNKANYFQYSGPAGYPTGGQYMIDPMLNLSALLNENNPQNRIRDQRAETLSAYLQYVEGVNTRNMEALAENQRINQEIQNQYNNQQNSLGAYASFGLGLAGAGLGFLKNGGHIKGFAKGGQSADNIPAMLMDGEFVMRKEAVNLYGKKFFDNLNGGRISKFANGGAVGNSNDIGVSTSNYNPTNNVNVTVNLNQQIEKTSESNTSNGERPQDEETRRNKQLAEQIKIQVIRVITEQQRPGGLLGSNIYKKQG